MANELGHIGTAALTTYYAVMRKGGQIVKTSNGTLVTQNSANWAGAAITLSDSVAAGHYLGSVPASTPAGRYDVEVYLKLGGSPALDDTFQRDKVLEWNGANAVASLLAATIDGVPAASALEAMLAVLAGVGAISGNQLILYKQDGITPKVSFTLGGQPGVRTAAAIT